MISDVSLVMPGLLGWAPSREMRALAKGLELASSEFDGLSYILAILGQVVDFNALNNMMMIQIGPEQQPRY